MNTYLPILHMQLRQICVPPVIRGFIWFLFWVHSPGSMPGSNSVAWYIRGPYLGLRAPAPSYNMPGFSAPVKNED